MSEDFRLLIRRTGGPEVIESEPIEPTPPAPGEVRVRHHAIGLNFIDTYHRSGLYPVRLPSGLGVEAAGIVEIVGEGVIDLKAGDSVAYAGKAPGAYATIRNLPARLLVKLPDAIDTADAAAIMLKGLTVDMLVGRCSRIQSGQTALVHAAAGGVGSILVQWLHAIGVRVIAHAGRAEKRDQAKALGADEALCMPYDELAPAVRELTGGRGVDVVFDGVGAASWQASLDATAKLGLIVSYGNASGPVPPVSPMQLANAGSLFLTRPGLFHYIEEPKELRAAALRLFAMIGQGKVKIDIGRRFPLAEAAEAHRALEARETTGSTLLIP